jgi:hypothetical protein
MTTGGVIADTHEAAAALTALIARVRELEGERGKCPLGDDCDLTVAWMAGQQEARDIFAARLDEARAREGLARADADNQRQKAEAAEAKLAEVEKERERLGREVNMARYGQPDFAWSIHKQAMAEMTARAETAEATVATLTAQVEAMRGAGAVMPEHVIRVAAMLIDSLHCLDAEAVQIATATNASGGVDGVQVLEDAEKIIKAAAGLVATELQGFTRAALTEGTLE